MGLGSHGTVGLIVAIGLLTGCLPDKACPCSGIADVQKRTVTCIIARDGQFPELSQVLVYSRTSHQVGPQD